MCTVVVSVVINRNTVGIGNSSLTTRASGKPAAKALGMIVGNQCVINLEACRLNALVAVAALDEHSAATPVISGIGRIVSDICLSARRNVELALGRRCDADTAALRVLCNIASYGSTRERKRGKSSIPSATINAAASLSRVVASDVATVNLQTAAIKSSNAAATVATAALVHPISRIGILVELILVIGDVAARNVNG